MSSVFEDVTCHGLLTPASDLAAFGTAVGVVGVGRRRFDVDTTCYFDEWAATAATGCDPVAPQAGLVGTNIIHQLVRHPSTGRILATTASLSARLTYRPHVHAVRCVAWSPPGSALAAPLLGEAAVPVLLASGGVDPFIVITRVNFVDAALNGVELLFQTALEGHSRPVTGLAFLRGAWPMAPASRLLSASCDATLRLWSIGDKDAPCLRVIDLAGPAMCLSLSHSQPGMAAVGLFRPPSVHAGGTASDDIASSGAAAAICGFGVEMVDLWRAVRPRSSFSSAASVTLLANAPAAASPKRGCLAVMGLVRAEAGSILCELQDGSVWRIADESDAQPVEGTQIVTATQVGAAAPPATTSGGAITPLPATGIVAVVAPPMEEVEVTVELLTRLIAKRRALWRSGAGPPRDTTGARVASCLTLSEANRCRRLLGPAACEKVLSRASFVVTTGAAISKRPRQ